LQPFLTSARSQEAIPGLIELLSDQNPVVRAHALQALGRLRGSPSVVAPAIVPLLDDADENVRVAAVLALGNAALREEAATSALRSKMDDNESTLAVIAAVALDQIDSREDIGPRLIELLKSPHRQVRMAAVGHLPDHVDREEAERVLTEHYYNETDELVKRAIARALNKLQQSQQQQGGFSSYQ
jgi:HEAT repeat protein